MFIDVNVRGRWRPGIWVRLVVVVVIYVAAAYLAPAVVLPLALGGCLGGWLRADALPSQQIVAALPGGA
jgi:hypothetical protein